MSLYTCRWAGFIFIVTGYSLDHVEHVIKQIFVVFNTNIQLGSLCTLQIRHTLTTELPRCPRASVVKISRCSWLDENQGLLPAHWSSACLWVGTPPNLYYKPGAKKNLIFLVSRAFLIPSGNFFKTEHFLLSLSQLPNDIQKQDISSS
jgi:hypothetical protein